MLLYFLFFSIPLIFCYLAIICLVVFHWKRTDEWQIPVNYKPGVKISVIVAARNESANISACLKSLKALKYPSAFYEILVVDDHSEDNTAAIIEAATTTNLCLLSLPNDKKGKKAALSYAISQAKGTLIVCTDADCVVPANWLMYISSYYQGNQVKFIAAPVSFYGEKNTFQKFQTLDFMGMMAISAAGVRGRFMQLSNGANLAFEKLAFEAVNGYEGHQHLASGDDMLLMEKIAALYPKNIGFLKQLEAQTKTTPPPNIRAFIDQRIRWASKSTSYARWQVQFILLMVWLLCISMVCDGIIACWKPKFWYIFFIKLLAKGFADFYFLKNLATYFKRKTLMRVFVPALFCHILYIIFIGFLANVQKKYSWKGRKTY